VAVAEVHPPSHLLRGGDRVSLSHSSASREPGFALTSRERRAHRIRGSPVRSRDGGAELQPAGATLPSPIPRGGRREGAAPLLQATREALSPLGLGPRSHASPQGLTLAGEVNSWVRVTRRAADSPARRGHSEGTPVQLLAAETALPRAVRLGSPLWSE